MFKVILSVVDWSLCEGLLLYVFKELKIVLIKYNFLQGVTNPQKRCTDFEIFGFHLKISLIFHKISLAKG